MTGQSAKDPSRGDWSVPSIISEAAWKNIIADFTLANEKLIELLDKFSADDWVREVRDERIFGIADRKTNNEQLLNGLIQHHAYHSGQIALLLKF